MVKLYIKKILNGDINPETGEKWCVADVPFRWREDVRFGVVQAYVDKIVKEEINPETEKPWMIDDVPEEVREDVREALEN